MSESGPVRAGPRLQLRLGNVVAVACLTLVVGLAACGTSQKTDAQRASDALTAGLQAQTQGRTQDAINDYNTVLAHDPKNKYAFYNLGLIDQQAGRNDSAEKNYRNALQIDPAFVPALFNLAILRTGPSPTEAESLYRHAISIDPKNAAAHLNLGFLLKATGRSAEATAEFRTAVSLDKQLASRVPAAPAPAPAPISSPSP